MIMKKGQQQTHLQTVQFHHFRGTFQFSEGQTTLMKVRQIDLQEEVTKNWKMAILFQEKS
ncbi:hypothetical protein PHJA_000126200 [Phtheirospermum japonicum]|uniref:Uncharacterized protein n=1 Tax=Phtheirospermum japonicum TaxID=374723 RepID=A0A830B4C2_9LAMI|nr:hypothetical protein PHJA_000126200 [Phtheirospermum japonicum]